MAIKNKQIARIWNGTGLLLTYCTIPILAIFVPLSLKESKSNVQEFFNLTIIQKQMNIANDKDANLAITKEAITKMYQNGSTETLSIKTQASVDALTKYVYDNKASKNFTFKFGKGGKGKKLLLAIATKIKTSSSQNGKSTTIFSTISSQPLWINNYLKDKDFGILFGIYQKRIVSQKSIDGTQIVDATIQIHNFEKDDPQDKIDTAQAKIGVTLPTQKGVKVNYGVIPIAINVNPPTKDGVSFTYKGATKVNDHGISTITYRISDNAQVVKTTTKDVTFDVGGFETKAMAKVRIAQSSIDGAQLKNGVVFPTKRNNVYYGAIPQVKDVNPPAKDGVSFVYKEATKVNRQGISTITYAIDTNSQVVQTMTKEVVFDVGGFETRAKFKKRIVQKKVFETSQTKRDNTHNRTNSHTKLKDVNHEAIPQTNDGNLSTKKGVTFKFIATIMVDGNGMSTLTFKVDSNFHTANTTTKEIKIDISNLRTQAKLKKRIVQNKTFKTSQTQRENAKDDTNSHTQFKNVNHEVKPQTNDANLATQKSVTFQFVVAIMVNKKEISTFNFEVESNPHIVGTTTKEAIMNIPILEAKVDQKK